MKYKKKIKIKNQIFNLILTAIIMVLGLFLLKFIPIQIFGKGILFDASMHITIACFILYIIYFFIDQNKSWRTPYFIFCLVVLTLISLQRIIVEAHNDIGLLMGLLISFVAICISNLKKLKGKFDF